MPATAAPFGLKPSSHPSGVIRTEAGTILSGYTSNILQYAPVRIAADGTLELAAPNSRAVGSFMGVEYTHTATGRRIVSNQWPANTVATAIVAYFTRDQKIRYRIQSSATLAIAVVGEQFDWGTATAGNTTTGLSSMSLNAGSSAGNAGLRVIGLADDPDNAWDDLFVNLIVEISEHQDTADVAAY
jgi:hypothetical protein